MLWLKLIHVSKRVHRSNHGTKKDIQSYSYSHHSSFSVRVFSHPRPSLPSVYSSEMPVLTFPRPPSVLSWPSQASTQPLSAAPEARDPESSFSKKPWLHLDTAEQEHLYDQPFIPRAMTEGDDT